MLTDDDLLDRALRLSDQYLGGLADARDGALGGQPELPLGLLHPR